LTYRVVFDIAQRIPEIAVGIAAAILLFGLIAAGLWAFGDLIRAWRVIAVASIAVAIVEAILEQSRSALFPLVFAVIAVAVDVFRDRIEALAQWDVPRGAPTTMVCVFLLLWTAGSGLGRFGAIDLANELNRGRADVLEGQVTQFSEVALKSECFTVEGRRFCYADSIVSPGFSRTRAYGGPINPGLSVRVAAIGDTIVRLEIAQP
jgi:hypothetical protein